MSTSTTARPYRVLARKYRPSLFAELIGQEALVRTLSNAIEGGRLAHAYLLTGVRGVGKTTAARLLARALNCIGADGSGGPTITPCGVCEHCVAITEDRHVDVLEMDAASRTGVDDIRELIDGVRYRPVSARNKVYIIDEVHMLSKQAFNALLKTLEEPPPHVTFIFATTEVRKVPVTVVSRCQRFDLRRIDAEALVRHLEDILAKEGAAADAGALALIARAADGSVRDALSMLDQAIAHCDGKIDEDRVRDMLGLADRVQVFDLFEAVMAGEIKTALDGLARQYEAGVDPLVVLHDLLELTHWLTRVKVAPAAVDAMTVPEAERRRGGELAKRLAMPVLARAWQMLLKGLGEARVAPNPLAAAEMVLVRLAYVADLPAPAELVQAIRAGGDGQDAAAGPPAPEARSAPEGQDAAAGPPVAEARSAPDGQDAAAGPPVAEARSAPDGTVAAADPPAPEARFAPDGQDAAAGPPVAEARSAPDGAGEQRQDLRARRIAEAKEHPLVKAVLDAFPEAQVSDVRMRAAPAEPAGDPQDEEETS
ncbi:MAG: DNA polymerase III subunit gamma/tau [Proteobacteria bacterium]|nr:DNA polymerase III subunit gamma/tau [Pseudomonadota bacterium]